MVKMKYGFILLIGVMFSIFSCDKKSLIEGDKDGQSFLIEAEQLYGRYEVTEGSLKELGLASGKVLQISDGQLIIHCNDAVDYSRRYNTLSIEGKSFLLVERSKGLEYQISYVTPTTRNFVTIKKTEKDCSETAPEEEEEDEDSEGPLVGNVELDKLYGYAVGTTGGEGATSANTHHFDDGNKFRSWLNAREKAKSKVPAIVWLSGTFTKENGRDGSSSSPWFDVKDTENITIYGTNDFKMQNIGFFIVRSHNIIIRNVYIALPKADNGADGISMQKSSRIWVDHCTFESVNQTSDYEDGACDITHESTEVTVSWNHFIKTQKSSLVGHSDNNPEDVAIRATYHHNFFDQTNSRHPRVRYGQVHVFNNYFKGAATYGVGSAYGAKVLVEGNYFDGVHLPTDICTFPAKRSGSSWVSNLTGKVAGYLYASDNAFVNKPSNASDPYPFTNVAYTSYGAEPLAEPLTRDDFLPPYSYVIDNPEEINTIVAAGAGVGKLSGYQSAPIAVDNGGMPDDGGTGGNGPGENEENPPIALENGWSALAYGASQLQAIAGADKKSLTLTGSGKFEGGKQEFSYVYREVTGNFVATVQLDSYDTPGESNQSMAGIFLTPNPSTADNDLLHVMVAKGGTGNFHYSRRLVVGNAGRGTVTPSAGSSLPILRLVRDEGTIKYAVSLDGGVTFGTERSEDLSDLPEKVFIGLAVSSGGKAAATAAFSDFKLNGVSVSF